MPFKDLDPQARQKEQQLESFLQLFLRKFIPTLQDVPTPKGDYPTIKLYPIHQGSQMPVLDPNELTRRSYERNRKGLERLYQQGGPA